MSAIKVISNRWGTQGAGDDSDTKYTAAREAEGDPQITTLGKAFEVLLSAETVSPEEPVT